MKINHAKVQFNEHGTPVAHDFDDVYYSNDNGMLETLHVFVDGNILRQRFEACSSTQFVIAETGFGTGLNFLVACSVFAEFRQSNPDHELKRLHFISTEKFPLQKADLEKALAHADALSIWRDELLNGYPIALKGAHRLQLQNVTLDLWYGDAEDMMNQWSCAQDGVVDAWFLDGFAPSKNPQMWTQGLFDSLARLSKPLATLATFTAAGFVRRGLIKAGFDMQKVPGFGSKREMLVGQKQVSDVTQSFPILTKRPHICVIGAGLAGANAAYALGMRGAKITIIDESTPASGASGNAQGGFYPQLHALESKASRIQAHSFLYAHALYKQLLEQGYAFAHDFCGVLQLAFSEQSQTRQSKLIANQVWPTTLVQAKTAQESSEIAGLDVPYDALFFNKGGWISPPELVAALLRVCEKEFDAKIISNCTISHIKPYAHSVSICTEYKETEFDHIVLATGHKTDLFESIANLPFRKVRGQVEYVPSHSPLSELKTVICHKGYLTPAWSGRHCLGSTYVRNDTQTEYRESEAQVNLQTHEKAMSESEWFNKVKHDSQGRASVRLTLPDHQPAVGKLVDPLLFNKVSVLTGLGSRGLTTAPLMAELLASELFQAPIPLSEDLYQGLGPNRFKQ